MKELDQQLINRCKTEKKQSYSDKKGERYYKRGVICHIMLELAIGSDENLINRKTKKMSNVLEGVNETFEAAVKQFESLDDKLKVRLDSLESNTKKSMGKVKTTVSNLSDSMTKINKITDFEKLERQALTLERIADALDRITEIDKSGKLDKVINALR